MLKLLLNETCQYPTLWGKTGPIFPPLVGLTAGWQIQYGWISKFLQIKLLRFSLCLKGQYIAFVLLRSCSSNQQWCYVKHGSHYKILRRKWLWAEITSKMVLSIVIMAFPSNTQKAGIVMRFRNIVILLILLLTVEWVASSNRWLAYASSLFIWIMVCFYPWLMC